MGKTVPLWYCMDKLRFLSIGSGSSGNCYYFGDNTHGILIDAGIAARTVRVALRSIGTDFDRIRGVFVSHDHVDHIKSIGTLGEVFHLPIYATAKTHNGIDRSWSVTQKLNGSRKEMEIGSKTQVGEFSVTPYEVSHDATESVCFQIAYRSHKILVATDLGCANEDICRLIRQSNIIVLEANYDNEMLNNGSYPYLLKQRIISESGHLCNEETARLLAENWHEGISHIYLCHLSKDNNLPHVAKDTVETCLRDSGIAVNHNVRIEPLNRSVHPLVVFES